MNKAQLIDRLAPQLGGRGIAAVAVEAVVDAIIREVAGGGTIGITGFGTFERVDRAPRTGRNPRTGAVVPIAGTSTPRFRAGTYFRRAVTEPGALPTDGHAGGRAPAGTAATPRRSGSAQQATTGRVNGQAATNNTNEGMDEPRSGNDRKNTFKGVKEPKAKEGTTGEVSTSTKKPKKTKQSDAKAKKKVKKG